MLLFLFLFGLALGAETPSGDHQLKLQRGNCPKYWFNFNGRCYKYVATRMTWADAELHCVSQRANLVSIHSVAQNNFVKSLIWNFDPVQGYTWIGLNDIHKEGRWMWSDGSAVNFVFWDIGQPDNYRGRENCAHKNFGNQLKWNDRQCSDTIPFVCVSRPFYP
ncbi:lactose-binding lectin l-2-like [Thunnus thynnus]|uniref:lactose-binding lectin l-2-like n=1 Tax=Thunnus thynnus TaxID=8237 RepID=UPI0035294189